MKILTQLKSVLAVLSAIPLFHFGATRISALPGELVWSHFIGDVIYASPAIGPDGTIVVGAQDGSVYAFNPDGSTKWIAAVTDDWIDASPTIGTDGTVYTASWDGILYALNGADGSLKWKGGTGGFIIASPAIGPQGSVYVGSNDGLLYAFSSDGTLRWTSETSGSFDPVNGAPVLNNEGTIVYFGTDSGTLMALDTADGTLQWRFAAADLHPPGPDESAEISSAPSIAADGTLYVTSENGYLYALDPDGGLRWDYKAADSIRSSVVIAEPGTLYFAAQDGYLYALDTEGLQLWESFIGDVFYSTPALDQEGRIIAGGYAGSEATGAASRITAFSPDGDLIWEFVFPGYHDSSPNIAPDGSIIFGSHDGILYKLAGMAGLMEHSWPRVQGNRWQTGRSEPGRIPELIDYFPGITFSQDGWSHVPWFGSGWIHDRRLPWIQHVDHGILFIDSPSSSGTWFYDSRLSDWLYGTAAAPNYFFRQASRAWLYHIPGTAIDSGRWFYDFASEEWFSDLDY